jgi:hypothetical protein
MDLINTTGLPAELRVTLDFEKPDARVGCLTAKATFEVGADRTLRLDTDSPVELLGEDTETTLGVMPSDLPIRRGPQFEVWMLGAAYAQGGAPTSEMVVTLSVANRSASLRVVGDRQWWAGPNGPVLSPPAPFSRMPLTWERAFGGSAEVWLDERSTTQVAHPMNPRGRGFDPTRDVQALGRVVYAAPGYPRTDYVRLAPNLEDPSHPIRVPTDAPEPLCFAPPPMDCGIASRRMAEVFQLPEEQRPYLSEVAGLRALPAWVFDAAPLGHPATLTGCRPDGDFAFVIPGTVPVMDYVLGDRTGSRPLVPQSMMILPEERRFYIVYRHFFMMRADAGQERSVRLRFE